MRLAFSRILVLVIVVHGGINRPRYFLLPSPFRKRGENHPSLYLCMQLYWHFTILPAAISKYILGKVLLYFRLPHTNIDWHPNV